MTDTKVETSVYQTNAKDNSNLNHARTPAALMTERLACSPRANVAFSLLETLDWLKLKTRAAFSRKHWRGMYAHNPTAHLHSKPV